MVQEFDSDSDYDVELVPEQSQEVLAENQENRDPEVVANNQETQDPPKTSTIQQTEKSDIPQERRYST